MSNIPSATLITRSTDIIATDLDGELVLMSIEKGNYYGIKGTALRIWELAETPCRVGPLCHPLAGPSQGIK
jgi:hypothetical protein